MLDVEQITRHRGHKLIDADGTKIGDIQEIYLDDDTGRPEWVLVNTGLFGAKSHFVPIDQAQPDGDDLRVSFTKDMVKDAPSVDADQHLSAEEERELYRHYGMDYDTVGTDTMDTAGTTPTTGTPGESGTIDPSPMAGTAGAAGGMADMGTDRGPVGHDTSGPTTDDTMTVSEEQPDVHTERRPTGKARLRKHVVTDPVQTTVPVEREEVRVVREPITDSNIDQAMSGPDISEEEHEITLSEEEVRVDKRTVPKERVRLEKDTVTEERDVEVDLRKEEVDTDTDARP